MNRKKYYNPDGAISEQLHELIITVAYGDASFTNRIKVYAEARRNSEVKNLLDEYTETANSVHSLPLEECPQEIIEQVQAATGSNADTERSFSLDFLSMIYTRPIASAAAGIIIVAMLITSVFIERQPKESIYTRNDVELASTQTKQALAIVGDIFTQTRESIKQDILGKKVSKPIKEGMNVVNDLLIEEKKNENIN